MNGQQGQPGPANRDCNALDETTEGNQTRVLAKCRAGKENSDGEEGPGQNGIDRPSTLASPGKVSTKNKAGYGQC